MIIHSKYRRAVAQNREPKVNRSADVAFGIAMLVLALVFAGWVDATVEEADLRAAQASADRQRADASENAWLSCLNRNVVYVNGQAHLCQLTDLKISQR